MTEETNLDLYHGLVDFANQIHQENPGNPLTSACIKLLSVMKHGITGKGQDQTMLLLALMVLCIQERHTQKELKFCIDLLGDIFHDIHSLYLDEAGEGIKVKIGQGM